MELHAGDKRPKNKIDQPKVGVLDPLRVDVRLTPQIKGTEALS